MHAAGLEQVHDLGRRDEDHLDAGEAGERAAIAALVARAAQRQAGALEQGGGLLLQPALRGHGDGELGGHHRPPRAAASRRSVWMAEPTAGTGLRRAEMGEQAVIAAAAGNGLVEPCGLDLEHEARVVFEVAAELGGEARAAEIDAAVLRGARSGA